MKNIERQKTLDKKKWLESEKENTDKSGEMPYCNYCLWQDEWLYCMADQDYIETECLCAKAYNVMCRRKGAKK